MIEKFEELIVWQKSRELCKLIQRFTLLNEFSKDFRLVGQVRGSSGSIMDNIAEGFERGGNKEFIQYLFFSRASNAELRSQLYRALDNDYIPNDSFNEAISLSTEIKKMIESLIRKLKDSGHKGYRNS